MPQLKLNLVNMDIGEVRRLSGVYKAPNCNRVLVTEAINQVLSCIDITLTWEMYTYDPDEGRIHTPQGDYPLTGLKVPHGLCQARRVIVMGLTLGKEIAQRINARLLDGEFTLALLMQGAAVSAIEQATYRLINDWNKQFNPQKLQVLPQFSPGYGDWSFDSAREILLSLIDYRSLGIELNEQQLIVPAHTKLSILGVIPWESEDAGTKLPECRNCPKAVCKFREREFIPSIEELEPSEPVVNIRITELKPGKATSTKSHKHKHKRHKKK